MGEGSRGGGLRYLRVMVVSEWKRGPGWTCGLAGVMQTLHSPIVTKRERSQA